MSLRREANSELAALANHVQGSKPFRFVCVLMRRISLWEIKLFIYTQLFNIYVCEREGEIHIERQGYLRVHCALS